MSSALPYLAPPLFVLLWSSAFVGAKFGLPHAEPMTFLAIRFALVTLLFVLIARALSAPWPSSWRQAGHIAVVGALVQGVYLGGVFVAIHRGVPAGLASLIVGLQPILTAVLAGRLLGERTSARQWGGLVLGLAGVAMVLGERMEAAHVDEIGLMTCIAGLVAISFGTLHQKRYASSMHVASGSAIQNLTAAVLTVLGALAFEGLHVEWVPAFTLSLTWLTVVVSIGAFSLLMMMIRLGEAVKVVSLFYMVPPTTALLAWLAFDERIGIVGAAGIAVTAFGVAMVVRPAAKAAEAKAAGAKVDGAKGDGRS
ncbi:MULTISPECIES: DMT family transporter [Thalassobaculum]|uniref:Permease of the drug/metabolite transporter (DMT) superfamily n=1 Tax=Thalassobaculum litoreum DSM 18839 TaxID=1123362 RepID=A0A8G2F0A3_9PROT|nr:MULTISPECIES: EamA family transporter [Thalassobaculum]SDG39841.1 Permease of the drug/metabolite transporter (DMT) superfamily [Thalassobaculum litoreum DSM 18839]